MKPLFITTSWDDGHVLDVRLSALLKKYGVKGTFYISPDDREVASGKRLTNEQIKELSNDFEIGAHTMTHPRLPRVNNSEARKEIEDSKKYLEKITGNSVTSFCYPCGSYSVRHVQMVRELGFKYARTIRRHFFGDRFIPFEAPTTIHTYNHWSDLWKIARFANFNPYKTFKYFQWDELAKAMFDRMVTNGGVYHLWGHSWEIEKHKDWGKLEKVLQYIANKKNVLYGTNGEIPSIHEKTVLIVTPYFPPHLGGVEMYVYNISKLLKKEYHWRVVIVTSGKINGKDEREIQDGVEIYRLPYHFKFSNTPFSFNWFTKIRRILKIENPDVINIHIPVPGMGDIAALVSGRKPVVLTYHAGSMRKFKVIPDIFIWIYEHFLINGILRRSDYIVCSSEFVKKDFLSKYNDKITVITPAVDIGLFKPPVEGFIQSNTVLFVGSLTRSQQFKGLRSIMRAVRFLKDSIPDIRLVVVGDGDMKSTYENFASEINIDKITIFKGSLFGTDLVRVFQEAGVIALVSSAPAESFGMVLIEAMACGKPVIGTKVGGIPYVIDDGKNGLLINSKNEVELAEAIKKIITNKDLAFRLGKNGLVKVLEKFQWSMKSKKYNDLFNSFIQNKLKVVQVSAYYPPHLGGLERVAQEVSEQLARDGHVVTVLTSNIGEDSSTNTKIPNLTVKRLWSFDFAHTAFIPGLLWRLLCVRKPAIFHLHLAQAYVPEMVWLASKLRGIPYVVHYHLDVGPSGKLGFIFLWWKRWIQPIIIKSATHVITLSPDQSKIIEERYGVPKEKVTFIGNGVGENFLAIGKHERSFHNPLRLLFVGRLSVQKRPERIVEAMSLIKEPVTLTMVGDGEDRLKLENLVAKKRLNNVTFRGILFGDDLLQAYKEADVFVLPSDKEGMPLVALEAMATALPIVGSDVLGITELIKGTGILVANPSPETFAEAIEKLVADPAKLKDLSRKSYEKAKEYSWEKLVKQLEGLYKEILI